MAKKKKLTLYVDLDADVRLRLDRLTAHRKRKLTAEVQIALERYLDAEEQKENLPPFTQEGSAE